MLKTWLGISFSAAILVAACSSTATQHDAGDASGDKTGSGGVISGESGGRGAGGSTSTGGQTGQIDAAVDASPSCAGATLGATCASEGTICSNCPDICQNCNQLRCTGGHWQRQEAAAAPCFACGPTLRCQINAQYCYTVVGGAVGNPPSYQCRTTPAACLPAPTCTCVRSNETVASSLCSDSNPDSGSTAQVTVTLQAP